MDLKSIAENKAGILDEYSRKTIRVGYLPYYYHVHLNMPCNQKCIMCVPDGKHARDLLSFEGFVSFFEQVQPYAEHITLIGGETFMYPWIDEVLDLLSQHPIAVTINTNATMLNEKISKKLLSLHELNLKCSIDAADASTYHRIRGVDDFSRVTENMRSFAERTRDLPHMRMIPVYVVMRENLHEVLPFLDFAEPLRPHRIEFHPVRHVMDWHVTNGTGWIFDGKEQSCELFADEYNAIMRQAEERCERANLAFEILYV